PSLAPVLMEQFPEVEAAGRMMPFPYGKYPIFGKETALIKNAVLIDSAAAAIFQVRTQDGRLWNISGKKEAAIVHPDIAKILFSPDSLPTADAPITLQALSTEQYFFEHFYGIAQERKLSHLTYDMLMIRQIYNENDSGNPFTYQTFVQVVPGTDLATLTKKINNLYQNRI